MPNVTCPSCGERGKISTQFIGARIKCRKCGVSFLVTAPAGKAVAGSSSVEESYEGIKVEGLDSTAWVLPTEVPALATDLTPGDQATSPAAAARRHEYKLLTQRDKFFEGKFDLARLEEALNHYAQEGWVARTMVTPQVKGYSGALQEEIVVLLER